MEAAAEPKSGACHQVFWRRRLKMETSNSWETMKAVPEASAMRSGAKMAERMRPTAKPTQATRRATEGPDVRLHTSVTK